MKSNDWHERRKGKITGSRVGRILGHSSWGNRDSVMREMVREHFDYPREFSGNKATQYGEDHEADAIMDYELATGRPVRQSGEWAPFVIHREHDWLGVTPDGFTDDGSEGIIEVKCPYRALYASIEHHPDYMDQVQLAMSCCDVGWCDFVIWREGQPLNVERIHRDPAWLENNLPALRSFIEEYRSIIADRQKAEPYLGSVERKDAQWKRLAKAYLSAEQAVAKAQKALDEAKSALIEEAPTGAEGFGVLLTRTTRSGTVAYAKALKALVPDADLTQWTGEPTSYYTVKVKP